MDWWWYLSRVEHFQKGRSSFIHTLDGILFCLHWNRCGLAQTNGMKTPRSSTGDLSKKRCTSWRWNKRDGNFTKIKRDSNDGPDIFISPHFPTVHHVRRWAFTSNNRNPGYKTQKRRGDDLVSLSGGSWI